MRHALFLCTGNSARSILAAAYLEHRAGGRFRAHSAGSRPAGQVHPLAIRTLVEAGIDPGEPRSKSWEVYATPDAPRMDVVITVCDAAAGEACPVWPGAPRMLHWSFADPAAATGTEPERRAAFERVFAAIREHVDRFLATEAT